MDNDTLRRVMNSPEAMAAIGRIEGWRSLGDNVIETIINKSEKVRCSRGWSVVDVTNQFDLSNDLQFSQKTMMEHMAKILEWEEVQPIFEYYLSCWPNDIPLNWARLAWNAAAKDGLPVYCSEKEEMKARSVATILSLFYYEYCHRSAWHENKNFKIWSDDIRANLKNDLLDHWKEVDELVEGVTQALLKNVDEASLPAELWINCVEASRGIVMSAKERSEMFTKLVNDQWQDFNYNQGACFVRAGFISEPEECESISGLGLF